MGSIPLHFFLATLYDKKQYSDASWVGWGGVESLLALLRYCQMDTTLISQILQLYISGFNLLMKFGFLFLKLLLSSSVNPNTTRAEHVILSVCIIVASLKLYPFPNVGNRFEFLIFNLFWFWTLQNIVYFSLCRTHFYWPVVLKTMARILDGWLSSINWLFKSVDYNKREISASCYCAQSFLDVSYCTRWITLISRLL